MGIADQPWHRLPAPRKARQPSFVSQKLVAPASSIRPQVAFMCRTARSRNGDPMRTSASYLWSDWLNVVSIQSDAPESRSATATRHGERRFGVTMGRYGKARPGP